MTRLPSALVAGEYVPPVELKKKLSWSSMGRSNVQGWNGVAQLLVRKEPS